MTNPAHDEHSKDPSAELNSTRDSRIPVRDAVGAYRALLRRDAGQPGAIPEPLLSARSDLNVRIYPYTKGPDLANDGLAYGERIRELNRAGSDLYRQPRTSLMTRSGRSVEAAPTFVSDSSSTSEFLDDEQVSGTKDGPNAHSDDIKAPSYNPPAIDGDDTAVAQTEPNALETRSRSQTVPKFLASTTSAHEAPSMADNSKK